MITLLLAVAVGFGGYSLAHFAAGLGNGWSIAIGAGCFVLFNLVVGRFVKKRMTAEMEGVQQILADGQKKLQAKMQRWQFRPPSSMQAAQREMFADMNVFVREAIARTDNLDKYRWFVPMIARQKATAQLQLYWMIKDFKQVDRLLPTAFLADPNLAAIKMARAQMLEAPIEEIRKTYDKATRRLRYNENVLLAATFSWILVKRNDVDGAFKVLTEALKNSDNEVLKHNHEQLMNNRPAHFSNTALGDQWFQLQLEEPRNRAPRQRSVYR